MFKCCAQDTDSASASYNTKFFDVATFIDNSDPLQIIVTSTGGDVFKNGQGTTVLTAVCYQAGSEVDAAGNGSYTWTKYNKDGVVDTSWGTNGSKTGKTLSVSSADVDTKATFMVVVALYSSLSQYIRGVVPGTYTISVRAKKTSTMSGYFYVTYNGNKTKYLFNKSTAFDWTDYSVTLTDVTDPTLRIYCYCRDASIYLADIMISEGAIPRKWTPAPNEIYTQEVKIDKRGIEVSNSASSQRTVITNTEFAGYYNDEVIFTLNKDETQTKKTTVDGELTVGKTKFVPMPTASEGLNIVILD